MKYKAVLKLDKNNSVAYGASVSLVVREADSKRFLTAKIGKYIDSLILVDQKIGEHPDLFYRRATETLSKLSKEELREMAKNVTIKYLKRQSRSSRQEELEELIESLSNIEFEV